MSLQDSDAVPDKALLATVLSYLKNKNLKETEEALRKELSNQGENHNESRASLHISAVGQSGAEPQKYEESYTSHHTAPSTSCQTTITTKATSQLANDNDSTNTTVTAYNSAILLDTVSSPLTSSSPPPRAFNEAATTEGEGEEESDEESDEEMEEEMVNISIPSFRNMPQLLRIGSSSPPHGTYNQPQLMDATTTTASGSSNDKTPLWVQKPAASTTRDLPIVVPSTTAPVLPITRPFNTQTMVIQSTPITSMVGKSTSQNINVPTSLLYRPLLAPALTMFPSSTNLINMSSMFLTNSFPVTSTNSLSIESLIKKTATSAATVVGKVAPQLQQPEITGKFAAGSFLAEPATGQVISFQDCSMSPSGNLSQQPPRTLASIPDSELTEQYLEVKAFAEDFKTRRIRLGFTQGAVGKSLAERGYSNFAQSTISRFEQMQLSPSNAATIRVILEKWLLEAENPEPIQPNSSVNLSEMSSRKRKKRAVFAPMTKSTLDDFFIRNPRPNRHDIEEISSKLDLLPEEVRVWFCNKRQKSKPSLSSSSSYEHESSHSATSSVGAPSPPPPTFGDMGMAQKRQSLSPLQKTPFTIEELSKSSSSGTASSSPLNSTCPSVSPVGLVGSITQSRVFPMLFNASTPFLNNPLNNPIMPQFVIPQRMAQTTC